MNILEARNARQESRFLFILMTLLGLRGERYAGYAYVAVLLMVFYGLYIYVYSYMYDLIRTAEIFSLSATIRKVQWYALLLLVPSTVLSSFLSTRKVDRTCQIMMDVDGSLAFLNLHFNHEKFARREMTSVCRMSLFCLLMNLVDYYGFLKEGLTHKYALGWILSRTWDFFNAVVLCAFVASVTKIRRRLVEIRKVSTAAVEEGKRGSVEKVQCAFKQKLLRQIYQQLHSAISILNDAFGLQLLITILVFFFNVLVRVQTLYWATKSILIHSPDITTEVLWICFYFAQYIYIARACHSTIANAELTVECLSANNSCYDGRTTEVNTNYFLPKDEIKFTAKQLFVIDYYLIRNIIILLIGYVILMHQTTNYRN